MSDDTYVERLRASKKRIEARDYEDGKAYGAIWAKRAQNGMNLKGS
jgi:hypothetical protein